MQGNLNVKSSGVVKDHFISIVQVLERRAEGADRTPVAHFFHDDSVPVSESAFDAWNWRELRDRVRGVAADLVATGAVETGSRVLLVYPAGLGFLAAFYGCLYVGVVPVPVPSPRRSEGLARCRHVACDASISGVLTADGLIDVMQPMIAEIANCNFCLAPAGADPAQPWIGGVEDIEAHRAEPSQLAFLQYTSGSTSDPKGVMVRHDNLMANLRQISLGYKFKPGDRMVSWLPHYHDMGLIGGILSSLYDGYAVAYMAPAAFLRRPLRWLALATHFRATLMVGPNFAFDHCIRRCTPEAAAGLDMSAVRAAFTGAEMIRPQTLIRFRDAFASQGFRLETFYCCYGMAEAVLFIAGSRITEPPYLLSVRREALVSSGRIKDARNEVAFQDPLRLNLAGCGRPAADVKMAIVNPANKRRLSQGEVGEVWVAGPNITAGYWGRPEQSAETFGLQLEDSSGWFRTGDLGFLHEEQLYITGRLKEVIIIRGQNHYPQDIEDTVANSHVVLAEGQAGAFALEIEGEERLGVVCELSRKAFRHLDADEVLEALRSAISRHHDLQLAVVALIRPGSLPRTPSGKVRRFACREGLMAGTLPVAARWEARPADLPVSSSSADRATWLNELREQPRARREDLLRRRLQEEVAMLAALPSGQLPSPDMGFFDLGLDSVAAVSFGSTLERELGMQPAPALMFEYPTLSALAEHLAATILIDAPALPPRVAREQEVEPECPQDNKDLAPIIAAEVVALKKLLEVDRTKD